MRVERVPFRLISAATAAIILAACGQKQSAPPPQTPEVGVITVQPTTVPVASELPGRTSAFLNAQVRARVDGIVLRRDFVEGSDVKVGQRLYKIDPAPYIAALNNAKASLAKAQANVVTQNALVARYKVLVAANAVSKQDYDNAVAAQGQAVADVAAGRAAVDTAQINLGYTDVVSPITGRTGLSQVTPGAYVQASAATLLTTVQQLDPVYVDLTQSSVDGLKLRRQIQEGRLQTQRHQRGEGDARARGRPRVSGSRQAPVLRRERRPGHGLGHGARDFPEQGPRAPAGHVRARAHRGRRERPRASSCRRSA